MTSQTRSALPLDWFPYPDSDEQYKSFVLSQSRSYCRDMLLRATDIDEALSSSRWDGDARISSKG